MGRVRASSACWLLWPAAAVLLVLASSIQPAAATPRDIFYSRKLQQTAFPQCLGNAACSASDPTDRCTALCPTATHDCVVYKDKTTCTNTLRPPVEIASMNPASAFPNDNDLCTGWTTDGAGATPLGPMFDGGDCSKLRQGYVYAIYDCSQKKVCLKATSCVGRTSPQEGPNSADGPIPGFGCPGVKCGCHSSSQAQAECGVVDPFTDQNWYMLKRVCGDGRRTENELITATTQGVKSGWETCYTASEGTTYSLQAHFDISNKTIDNQQPNKDDHGLIFKTPTCPSTTPCANPQLSLAGLAGNPSVCASGATAQVVFSYADSRDIKDPTTSDLVVKLLQADDTTTAIGVSRSGDVSINTDAKTITVTIAPTTASSTFAQSDTNLSKVQLTMSVKDTCDITTITKTSAISIVLAPFLEIFPAPEQTVCGDVKQVSMLFTYVANHGIPMDEDFTVKKADQPVACDVELITGPTRVNVTCPLETAKAGVTLHGRLDAAAPCTDADSSDANSQADGSVNVDPEPNLVVTAKNASVCGSATSATVAFDFSTSENMSPLSLSQFTVTAVDAEGKSNNAIRCKPTLGAGGITVVCGLSEGPLSNLGSASKFAKVVLQVNQITGKGTCGDKTVDQSSMAYVDITMPPSFKFGEFEVSKVCETDKTVTIVFPYTASHGEVTVDTFRLQSAGSVVDCTKRLVSAPSTGLRVECPLATVKAGINVVGTLKAASPCANTDDATDSVKAEVVPDPAPQLGIMPGTGLTCNSDNTVTVEFNYSGSTHMADLDPRQLTVQAQNSSGALNTEVTCSTPSVDANRDVVSTSCSPANKNPFSSLSSDFAKVVLRVSEITGTGACGKQTVGQDFTAAVTIVPKAQISITAPEGLSACYGADNVTATFSYSVSNQDPAGATPAFDIPQLCSQEVDSTARTVSVTCPTPVSTISITGRVYSKSPCTAATATKSTAVTSGTAPTATLTLLAGEPKAVCSGQALRAVFGYTLTSEVGGNVKLTPSMSGATCTIVSGGPVIPASAASSDVSRSGNITVECTGTFAVGASPTVTLLMQVNKNGCAYKVSDSKSYTFPGMLCCTQGTSYAALMQGAVGNTCFKDPTSSCDRNNRNWGFYVKTPTPAASTTPTVISAKLLSGAGNAECTKGTEVGGATLTCTPDATTGAPKTLMIEVRNYAGSAIIDQQYYVGCINVTACGAPGQGFGAASRSDSCSIGSSSVTCGGNFPSRKSTTTADGWTTTSFSVGVNTAQSSTTKCKSCGDVIWVVHQAGTYRGSPSAGQCSGATATLG